MHENYENLFVGPMQDYEKSVAHQEGWRIVHATKEPYHRRAVGYEGRDASPSHPEYLVVRRSHRMMLNLIDAPVEVDIPRSIYDSALSFIHEGLQAGAKVLIHCEQGVSRSASIGMLYLRRYTNKIPADQFKDAEAIYHTIYPPFSPGKAIRYFLRTNWAEFPPLVNE